MYNGKPSFGDTNRKSLWQVFSFFMGYHVMLLIRSFHRRLTMINLCRKTNETYKMGYLLSTKFFLYPRAEK